MYCCAGREASFSFAVPSVRRANVVADGDGAPVLLTFGDPRFNAAVAGDRQLWSSQILCTNTILLLLV